MTNDQGKPQDPSLTPPNEFVSHVKAMLRKGRCHQKVGPPTPEEYARAEAWMNAIALDYIVPFAVQQEPKHDSGDHS